MLIDEWFSLACLQEPYKDDFESYEEMVDAITVDGHRPPIPEWFPLGVVKLVERCWDAEPTNRLSFHDILAQNWYVMCGQCEKQIVSTDAFIACMLGSITSWSITFSLMMYVQVPLVHSW